MATLILLLVLTGVGSRTSTRRLSFGPRAVDLSVGMMSLFLPRRTITSLLRLMILRTLTTLVDGSDVEMMATLVLAGPLTTLKVLATLLLAVPI